MKSRGPSRFDRIHHIRLLVQRKLGACRVALRCSSSLGMLMIAEHIATAELHGDSRRRNIGLGNFARAISFNGLSLVAWTTDGALMIERDSILPSVLRPRHKEHNEAVMAFATACKEFAETKELPRTLRAGESDDQWKGLGSLSQLRMALRSVLQKLMEWRPAHRVWKTADY